MLSMRLTRRCRRSKGLNTSKNAAPKKFTASQLLYRIGVMGSPIYRLDLKDLVWRGVSLSIAAAVVLVFLGPAVDHHFAERQHNHSHLYLTASAAEHGHPGLHPFEEPHSHIATNTKAAGHHGIIYQTSNDGLGDSGTDSVKVFIDDSVPPLHSGDFLPNAQTDRGSDLREAFLAPLKRPPRA